MKSSTLIALSGPYTILCFYLILLIKKNYIFVCRKPNALKLKFPPLSWRRTLIIVVRWYYAWPDVIEFEPQAMLCVTYLKGGKYCKRVKKCTALCENCHETEQPTQSEKKEKNHHRLESSARNKIQILLEHNYKFKCYHCY